jgi:hypothetical protein
VIAGVVLALALLICWWLQREQDDDDLFRVDCWRKLLEAENAAKKEAAMAKRDFDKEQAESNRRLEAAFGDLDDDNWPKPTCVLCLEPAPVFKYALDGRRVCLTCAQTQEGKLVLETWEQRRHRLFGGVAARGNRRT